MKQILVGVDGSGISLDAVEWAAREARLHDASLRIVHAVVPWLFDVPADPRVSAVREWLHDNGRAVLAKAVAAATAAEPAVKVSADLIPGGPAKVLLEAAQDADMVVVGSTGVGGIAGALLGSTALQVVSYAPCPAVAVRPPVGRAPGEVVVGVDGSTSCRSAVRFAFQEAALRGAGVRAVLAFTHPISTGPGDMQPLVYDPALLAVEQERALAESLAGHRQRHPDVAVVRQVVHARAARALAEASAGADLLVVGSRGRGGFTGLLLGSVGHAMLHHARCPVAVIRPDRP
ncbi:universal stress protein [Thermomonospora cellulosilytica]|uniref:Nucleotide-binding universal stress UspA family protein n=1 Tax=Thermomonospora cellulosilytica TaxID=1411118 RepID=A0A7W3MVP7_9ACTN|nr:universal stress protein [Thermomonospora cellulosilytica]MBA9002770.1 nucleotide-binding universal stress UspA family protein [Thermomonospora cellulosilytica]